MNFIGIVMGQKYQAVSMTLGFVGFILFFAIRSMVGSDLLEMVYYGFVGGVSFHYLSQLVIYLVQWALDLEKKQKATILEEV
jgi:hypothetical protein